MELHFNPQNKEETIAKENEINRILSNSNYISGISDALGRKFISIDKLNFKIENSEYEEGINRINYIPLEENEILKEQVILANKFVKEDIESKKELLESNHFVKYRILSLEFIETKILVFRYNKLQEEKK